jgi:peptidoglycan/xylan/chitin deacetylase (PgdA/CDA1 family)
MLKGVTVNSFLFHEISDDFSLTGFQGKSADKYKLSLSKFQKYIELISQSNFKVYCADNNNIDTPVNLLTFDDGGRSALDAADIIEKYGYRGYFFITTSMIGKKGFLQAQEIQELSNRGHIIGTHTHNHYMPFYSLDESSMFNEWELSTKILADILGKRIQFGSIPGGDMNLLSCQTAAKAGISTMFTSEISIRPFIRSGVTCFGRVPVSCTTSSKDIQKWSIHKVIGSELLKRKMKNLTKRIYYRIKSDIRRPGVN